MRGVALVLVLACLHGQHAAWCTLTGAQPSGGSHLVIAMTSTRMESTCLTILRMRKSLRQRNDVKYPETEVP